MKAPIEDRFSSGFVRVEDATKVLEKTREWIYRLMRGRNPKLEFEMHCIEGQGLRPVKLITLESLIAYIHAHAPFEHRERMKRKARHEARHLTVRDWTRDDLQRISGYYAVDHESIEDLAATLHTSPQTIKKILESTNTPIRDRDEAGQVRQEVSLAQLLENTDEETKRVVADLYREGHGPMSISESIGWGKGRHGTVRRLLIALGVELRDQGQAQKAKWQTRNSDNADEEEVAGVAS